MYRYVDDSTLLDVTNNPFSAGIFSYIYTAWTACPWANDITAATLDLDYYAARSGRKLISPMVRLMLDDADLDQLDATLMGSLAGLIVARYANQWDRLWTVFLSQYAPLENYNMKETMTDDDTTVTHGKSVERTLDSQHTKTGTETTEPDLTDATTHPTETVSSDIYGMDSSSPSPSDKTETSYTGTDEVTHTGTTEVTYDTTDADTGTITDAESGTTKTEHDYVLTRSGNIGVTTSQQMAQSEIDLWKMFDFFKIVYADIDSILTLPVY